MPAPLTHPAQQKTPAGSSAGRRPGNCTKIVQRVVAQALTVTHTSEMAAIHCHTPAGTVLVVCDLSAFMAAARADRDANGRHFPEARAARAQAACIADAAALPAPAYSPRGRKLLVKMTPERRAKIDEAARRIIANPGMRATPVAEEIGEPVAYLYKALGRLRRQERAPVAKPNGRLL